MQSVPDILAVHRVQTDDAFCKVNAHAKTGALCIAVGYADFTIAANPFIRIDADKDRMPWNIAYCNFCRN